MTGFLLAWELVEADLGYALEYATLSRGDLQLLAENFRLEPSNKMPYPSQEGMIMRLYEKLLQRSI